MNNMANILSRVTVETDTGNIIADGHIFEDCMRKTKGELAQWLYCVLHTGNINSISADTFNKASDITEYIRETVSDPKVLVPITAQNKVTDGIIDYLGVRVRYDEEDAKRGTVSLSCHRPCLTPGFYMFVNTEAGHGNEVIRHYIAARDYKYAVNCWSTAIEKLLADDVKFSAKVLSNTSNYPRNDAVVFYCSAENAEKVRGVLADTVKNMQEDDPMEGSPFCSKVVNNLSCAEQPVKGKAAVQSFGEHRCNCIADAIQDCFTTGLPFEMLLANRLKQYSIDKDDLSKNL